MAAFVNMSNTILNVRRSFERVFPLLKVELLLRNSKRSHYIVLLPEIPPDTPETNHLLQKDVIPDFNKVTVSNYVNALGRYIIEFESGICRIENNIESGDVPKTLDELIEPIEKLSAPLESTFYSMQTFSKVINNSKLNDSITKLQSRVVKCKTNQYVSFPIYNTLKELNDQKCLNESQKRLVNKYLLESRLQGIEFTGYNKGHYENVLKSLQKHSGFYRSKLEISSKRFKHTLHQSSLIQKFPTSLVKKMASNQHRPSEGPWNVTLEPSVYKGFMENCSDRMIRWNVWQANVLQASYTDSDLNNSIEIEELRFFRKDLAKLLGYETFVDLSMETKMAKSVDNVKAVITSLHQKSKSAVEEELLELQEFALQNGFDGQLEIWDVPYWRKEQNQALYSLDDREISEYFPLDHVVDGLFGFCKNMFGIEIKDSSNEVNLWEKEVKYYKVYDENGKFKGSFFFDAFQRPGLKSDGSSSYNVKSRNVAAGVSPLSYLIFNYHLTPGQKALLTFEDVSELFKKFGNLLQNLLSDMPYSAIAGTNNLEWDTVEVVPYFMAQWLTDYNTVAKISKHAMTEEPLPKALHDKIKKSRNHMAGYDLNSELYLCAFDIEIHTKKDYWMDIMRSLWAEYMPFELDKKDCHPCSFTDIFCGNYPASYYCHKWSEMIAADVFGAFYEAGLANEKEVQQIGRRFRDTYLTLGGGCQASEVFRRFRGRDPSLDALLISRGLKKIKSVSN